MGTKLTASHTLVRTAGVWEERPIDEDSLPSSVIEGADQVRGAAKGVTWCLRRGYTHDIPADVADELRAARIGQPGGLHGRLIEVADPQPPRLRVVEPAYDAARAHTEIAELRALVASQGEELARLTVAQELAGRKT